jgi:hypothetical protein
MSKQITELIESIDKLRAAIERQQETRKRGTLEDALAMLVIVGPNVAEIARRLGVNRRVLYRSDFALFQKALEVARDKGDSRKCMPRGHIGDGRVEAWAPSQSDE